MDGTEQPRFGGAAGRGAGLAGAATDTCRAAFEREAQRDEVAAIGSGAAGGGAGAAGGGAEREHREAPRCVPVDVVNAFRKLLVCDGLSSLSRLSCAPDSSCTG